MDKTYIPKFCITKKIQLVAADKIDIHQLWIAQKKIKADDELLQIRL